MRKRFPHDMILYFSRTIPLSNVFLSYSNPTEDSLLSLSQGISLLFQSDRGFFTIPLSKDFVIIPVRQDSSLFVSQGIYLLFQSDKNIHYCTFSRRISLLFQPDSQKTSVIFLYCSSLKRLLHYSSHRGFFTIPVRQKIIHYSSLRGFLCYSSPREDSSLFLPQRISLLFLCQRICFMN